ncbi:tetratricopeptide repeat protein [Desulfurobacterium sp.]
MKGFKREIDSIIREARRLIENKKYHRAISELEKHKAYSRDVEYFLLLAEAYERIGNEEKAEEYFEQARFLEATIKSKERLKKSHFLIKKKEYVKAREALLEAIELDPFEPEVYIELHKLYKRQGLKKEAAKVLKSLMTVAPFSDYPYLELAGHYYSTGNYDMVDYILSLGLERIDKTSFIYESARLYQLIGEVEKAEALLREACNREPENVDYRQKLVDVLIGLSKIDEALSLLMDTLKLYPESPYLLQSIATVYELKGDDEKAEFFMRKAVSVSDSFIKEDSMRMLADFLIEKGKIDQAEEILREIIETAESSWLVMDAFIEFALICMEQNRTHSVIDVAKKILKSQLLTEEELLELLEILSDVLEEEGHIFAARKVCEYVIKRSKNEKQLKRCYANINRLSELISLEKMWKKRN